MKKALFLIAAMLVSAGIAMADEVTVGQVIIPQGGTAMVNINVSNSENTYTAGEMKLVLPEGVTVILNDNGNPTVERGERIASTNHGIGASHIGNGAEQFTIFSISSEPIPGSDGTLFSAIVTADESLSIGTTLDGRLIDIELSTPDGVRKLFNDQVFTITIGEPTDPWITLDETSTTVPEAAENVDVRVKRTINANEWSTLVLPFDMTEAQVKAAFGDDVQLAEYIDHEMNDEGTQLTVTFDDANLAEDGLMANNPYIIKTSSDITEFTVDGVTIAPDEEGAITEYTNGRSGSRKVVYGTFRGTYHAQTVVPTNSLFLSENMFWYSKGQTKMKAFRAYFDFVDVLISVDEGAGARVMMSFSGTTGISDNNRETTTDSRYYDLQGRRVEKPAKGIYLRNGKKQVVR